MRRRLRQLLVAGWRVAADADIDRHDDGDDADGKVKGGADADRADVDDGARASAMKVFEGV
eukprot:8616975-Pyramimonas_sp.AAC.1